MSDFYEKFHNLAFADFDIASYSEDEQRLYHAAKAFLLPDESEAEYLLRDIIDNLTDGKVKEIALSLLYSILVWTDRFNELESLGFPRDSDEKDEMLVYNTMKTSIVLPEISYEFEMNQLFDFLPSIKVKLNNADVLLAIDTGAAISVISESTAKICGIEMTKTDLQANNAHESSVTTQLAIIQELTIGGLIFNNKSCIIIPDKALPSTDTDRIYGIIGWEIISRCKWIMDYASKKVIIDKSKKELLKQNMSFNLNLPLVSLSVNDHSWISGIDTGCSKTHLGKCVASFFDDLTQTTKKSSSAGSFEVTETGASIPRLAVKIQNTEIDLIDSAWLFTESEYIPSKQFVLPMVLGSDIAHGNILIIDYPNRYLDVVKPQT